MKDSYSPIKEMYNQETNRKWVVRFYYGHQIVGPFENEKIAWEWVNKQPFAWKTEIQPLMSPEESEFER